MTDLIVKAAVKDALADQNVAADFYDALDEDVGEILEDAARRAEDSERCEDRCNRCQVLSVRRGGQPHRHSKFWIHYKSYAAWWR